MRLRNQKKIRVSFGIVIIVALRCPHHGCRLEWNPAEFSWDYPCHGSGLIIWGNYSMIWRGESI